MSDEKEVEKCAGCGGPLDDEGACEDSGCIESPLYKDEEEEDEEEEEDDAE